MARKTLKGATGPPVASVDASFLHFVRPAASSRLVVDRLRGLLAMLQMDDGGIPPGERPDEGLDAWDDEEYRYVELRLPGRAGPDLDISVHRESVLIRIGR